MRALAANAGELAKRIDELHRSVDAQTKEIAAQNTRNARKIFWMGVVVALIVAMGALITIGYVKQSRTSARLEAVDGRQEVVRSEVLCPMFRVFLGGYQPETRKPGPDRDKYEAAFAEMRKQYAVLNCTGDLVPPRSDVVTKPPK